MKIVLRIYLALACLVMLAVLLFAIIFRDRRSTIYFATLKGDTNYIGYYLASGHDVNHQVICYRFGHRYASLLNVAVGNTQLETVDFLLKKGANPNQPDGQGDTPLMVAIAAGHPRDTEQVRNKVSTMLLKAGADPNLRSSWNYNGTPLIKAASFGEAQIVNILLTAGADVNATNKIGQSVLHLARNAEVARLLIDAGADLAART